MTAGLALLVLAMTLAGCPPRKPTPVAWSTASATGLVGLIDQADDRGDSIHVINLRSWTFTNHQIIRSILHEVAPCWRN